MPFDWGRGDSEMPIRKTHPYEVATFSNPRKRKVPYVPIKQEETQPIVHAQPPKEGVLSQLMAAKFVLSEYVSLIFKTFFVILLILITLKFILAAKNDIKEKTLKSIESNRKRIEECKRNYKINRCTPGERVPALEAQCNEWEVCMQSDPLENEITKVAFKVAGETVEAFFSSMSIRSTLITTAAASAFLAVLLARISRPNR